LKKNWPAKNFSALARQLRQAGMAPEFMIGPAEQHFVYEIREGDAAIPVHVPATLTALREILLCGDAYVGNDSGVSHLAAFLGLPTLVLFGPSDPFRWRPWGRSVAVLTPPGPQCHPCFESGEKDCDGDGCLGRIRVTDVVERLVKHLAAR
jgi:ADP-heptose:LPS heptosyltransferase